MEVKDKMKTKQEEIREGLMSVVGFGGQYGVDVFTDEILNYLDSKDCVIRGNSLGGSHPHLANYFEVEPLVEVKDGD